MKKCNCASCLISGALDQGKIDKTVADAFLLGYHYYGMMHESNDVDAGWHAEGVDFYASQMGLKPLAKVLHITQVPPNKCIKSHLIQGKTQKL